MRNPLGYKVLRTYQQGETIYELVKNFTSSNLHPMADSRLIAHMNDSSRSIPRNIAEGYGRNKTKQYYEFLGFSFGSLLELLEDALSLERDIKEGRRKTKDNDGALRDLSKIIKLCFGEKTMLKNQMEKIESMVWGQGLMSQNQRIARISDDNKRKNEEFDRWLNLIINNGKSPKQ